MITRALSVIVILLAPVPSVCLDNQGTRRLRSPDVRYVPTPQAVVEAMLAFANVTAADVVYDLGSGDGRIPITAAEKFGARGVGIEIDPFHVLQAEGNLARSGARGRVTFRNEDLFEADIRDATVVTLFLFPTMRARLIPFLKRSLPPGARIVAYHFDLGPDWPADAVQDVDGAMIYRWTVK
ncbi:MAG: methyltransferase domain-containing protein [Luteitalea sp.]|nr:methyltransferase domain-containing protein [Luteitalea sp.]